MSLPGRWLRWLDGSSLEPGLRRRLSADARRHSSEAARLVADGDADGAERELAAVERIGRVLAAGADGRERARLGVLVALGCLVLVSVAIGWRPGDVPVALNVGVTELTLRLARPWRAEGDLVLASDRLRLDGDLALEAPGIALPQDVAFLDLQPLPGKTGRLQVGLFGAEAGTELRVTADGGRPSLSVGGGSLSGRINAREVRLVIKDDPGESTIDLDEPHPEVLRFSIGGHRDNPARIELPADKPWSLDGLFVDRLAFEREQGGQGRFVSTVEGGNIRLLDLGSELTLHQRDRLDLGSQVEGHYLRVGYEPKTRRFQVRFEGTGPASFNWPGRFRAQPRADAVGVPIQATAANPALGAIVFLWGLLWGVRGWMRGS